MHTHSEVIQSLSLSTRREWMWMNEQHWLEAKLFKGIYSTILLWFEEWWRMMNGGYCDDGIICELTNWRFSGSFSEISARIQLSWSVRIEVKNGEEMKSTTRLDSAVFHLTPTRTRWRFLLFGQKFRNFYLHELISFWWVFDWMTWNKEFLLMSY